MKNLKIYLFASFIIMFSCVFGQVPQSFNYQAVLRDSAGQIIPSQNVAVEISIFKGSTEGTVVFSETHITETTEFGLINLQIGSVESLSGVSWNDDIYFIGVSVDGELMGTSQLLSVPFALHAKTSADSFSGDYTDLINTPELEEFIQIENANAGDLIYYTENGWQNLVIGSEGQVLTVSGGIPAWANLPQNEEPSGTVTDIDGNVYPTVVIGNQEWMAENLRTTKFNDGSDISTNIEDWGTTPNAAYVVYPHTNVDGIDSYEMMVNAYGKLYNWFAVTDPKGLCPAGWKVPSHEDWLELTNFAIESSEAITADNVANTLKSCKQVDSPFGGDCATSVHPRWNANATHNGTDDFGLSLFAAGSCNRFHNFLNIAHFGFFWSSTQDQDNTINGLYRRVVSNAGNVQQMSAQKQSGYSIRCIRE
jgi:uncharacterized protein (TIGR02145 family)